MEASVHIAFSAFSTMRSLWLLICTVVCCCDSLEWPNASSELLSTLQTQYDHCFMQEVLSAHSSPNLQKDGGRINCPLPDSKAEARCSIFVRYHNIKNISHSMYIPSSMTHTLPDLSASYPHFNHITELLTRLNQSNRALVLVGDSITRNSIEALMCILQRETPPSSQPVTISPPLEKILYSSTIYTIALPHATIFLFYHSLWRPFQTGTGGTTTSFHGDLLTQLLNRRHPHLDALVVFNVGMHERGFHHMTRSLIEMFTFARETLGTIAGRNITFLYREASEQHYDEPAGLFNPNKAKQWRSGRLPPPVCHPRPEGEGGEADWRCRAEKKAMSQAGEGVKVIPFRELSRHFWDIHRASPAFLSTGRGSDDCTHYPAAAAPLLYRLLWHQILLSAI